MQNQENFLRCKRNRNESEPNQQRRQTRVHLNNLPITFKRREILELIKNNQVIIIQGSTGCGKTTQVPQYLYEEFTSNNLPLNIIITQPRRLAAISIANRLAHEMKVDLGSTVGYQIGLNSKMSERTQILIVTTGIFLQRLIHNENLNELTHIILDEVHERDIEIDFVMILLKHVLSKNSKIKLILMSATIMVDLFSNYFSEFNIKNVENIDYYKNNNLGDDRNFGNAPILKIQHELFEKRYIYLDEIIDKCKTIINTKPALSYLKNIFMFDFSIRDFQMNINSPFIDNNLYELCCILIHIIDKKEVCENEIHTTILIFLPGVGEIQAMQDFMNRTDHNFEILQLHSNLNDTEQKNIFNSSHKRKVILSTNIAESSITIPDVSYVIDFCLTKILKFDIKTGHETLELNWASRASSDQRAGRVGRISEGFVFRLVTYSFYFNDITSFSSPQLLRQPLQRLILKIKIWDENIRKSGSEVNACKLLREPEKILGRAIQPPDIEHIDKAINNLHLYGALRKQEQGSGFLTELGRVYAELPIDIRYSRLIMIANAFGLIEPAIINACILSQEKSIFLRNDNITYAYEMRKSFSNDCDFIFMINIYLLWEKLFGRDIHIYRRGNRYNRSIEEIEFCKKHYLNMNILREVKLCISDISKRLNALNLITVSSEGIFEKINLFKFDNDSTFFYKIVLAGAFYPKLIKCQYALDLEKMRKNKSKCINYKNSVTIKALASHGLEEEELIHFFNSFGEVEKIKCSGDDLIVEFKNQKKKEAIEKLLSTSSNRSLKNLQIFANNSDTPINLRKAEHLYEIKFIDLFSKLTIEIDYNSINHVLIEDDPNDLPHYLLVSDEYYSKNAKYLCKNTSRLPMKPMLDLLLVLIFTPNASFSKKSGQRGDNYYSFKPTETDSDIRFTHLFSSDDVKIINRIRKFLNNLIISNSENKDSQTLLMKETFMKLINKSRRIKIIDNSSWNELYKHYINSNIKLREVEYNYNEENDQEESEGFLPPLRPLKIKEDLRHFNPGGIKDLEEERANFFTMRTKYLEDVDKIRRYIGNDKPHVICSCCHSYITTIKSIIQENLFFRITSYVSAFVEIIPNSDNINDIYVDNFRHIYNYSPEFWIACPINKKILGFKNEHYFYLSQGSDLIIEYPEMENLKWEKNVYNDNFKLVYEKLKVSSVKRDNYIKNNLKCLLCRKNDFADGDDYLKHIDKDPSHLFNLQELQEEIFLEHEY